MEGMEAGPLQRVSCPCRAILPILSTGRAVAISSGCVGEEGVHACPPPSTVFLAFRVTLQSHSANLSAAPSPQPPGYAQSLSGVPLLALSSAFPNTPVLDVQ